MFPSDRVQLDAYCAEMERDWEEGLPWLMLEAREVTEESAGITPDDLVFEHTGALCSINIFHILS